MNYYYFAASLPTLSLDGAPPMSLDAFVEACRQHLRPSDFAALRALLDGTPSNQDFVRAWRDKEVQLRNALVRQRAARTGQDAAAFLRPQRGVDGAVDKQVNDAYGRSSPLEREQALDRLRWTQAETLAGLNAFAIEAVLAYAIQLRLAARWAGMDETVGQAKAREIVAQQPAA